MLAALILGLFVSPSIGDFRFKVVNQDSGEMFIAAERSEAAKAMPLSAARGAGELANRGRGTSGSSTLKSAARLSFDTRQAKTQADRLLHVEGNKLMEDGKQVILRGVNVPSLESSSEGDHVFRSCRVALEDWHSNCIRLPLSQDRWFGKAPGPKKKASDYRDAVVDVVTYVTRSGGYVILDLAWSDAGQLGKNLGEHRMPDEVSAKFWKDVAHAYRSNGHVLFDLYSAPQGVDWKTWRDGGLVTEKELSYKAVGMSKLLDDVRKTGARNVVVIGGLNHGASLSGLLDGYALADPSGNGILYDAHVDSALNSWDEDVNKLFEKFPVIIGEGSATAEGAAEKLLRWMEDRGLSWTLSAMRPKTDDSLISDWAYTPTTIWGEQVKKLLSSR